MTLDEGLPAFQGRNFRSARCAVIVYPLNPHPCTRLGATRLSCFGKVLFAGRSILDGGVLFSVDRHLDTFEGSVPGALGTDAQGSSSTKGW
jgi:hypothetical protein